jgi:methionyl-tRNA synthetase
MTAPAYFISTAIPYVNARPHIGFALELVQADAFARYARATGKAVRFLTGTDENSLKNVLAAEEEGLPVAEFVERNAQIFIALGEQLAISNDDFIRTGREARHRAGAQRLWSACAERGDIYKQTYGGLYCVGCEQFYGEDELVDGRCPEHGTVPEWVEEENYFFRLSRYQTELDALIASGRLRVVPESRRNEVLSFVRMGLQDFSISRSRRRAHGWGIEVPGDPEQVMYVWFDALANYITALGYGTDGPDYRRFWTGAETRRHVIGKGIIRFHAIYWPAMLLSAGVPLPNELFVHGYLTAGGRKIGKSLGNAVDPFDLIAAYGAEAVRYHLLAEVPATGDADFTLERFAEIYNNALANNLGNFVQRSTSMVHRYREGRVPAPLGVGAEAPSADGRRWQQAADQTVEALHRGMAAMDPQAALRAVWRLLDEANRYVESSAPWTLAKRARQEQGEDGAAAGRALDDVLYNLIELARLAGACLHPYLPATAARLARQVGLGEAGFGDAGWPDELTWGRLPPGTALPAPQPLFPKVESDVAAGGVS